MERFSGSSPIRGRGVLTTGCWRRRFDGTKWRAASIQERETTWPTADFLDLEVSTVMAIVMVGTQADQRIHVGTTTVGLMGHVVTFDVMGCLASRVSTATVAIFDQASGAGGDDALSATDVDRGPFGFPDGLRDPVAGLFAQQVRRQSRTLVEPAAAGSVEMQIDTKLGGPPAGEVGAVLQ